MNVSLTQNNSFPDFFDNAQLVYQDQLGEECEIAYAQAKDVFLKTSALCCHEGYALAPQVIERFFMSDKKILGYQCVFFDKDTTLNFLEQKGLRTLTFKELVNSLDSAVLVKVGLVWESGLNVTPTLSLFSSVIENEKQEFMRCVLKPFSL